MSKIAVHTTLTIALSGLLATPAYAATLEAWRALGCRDGGRVDIRCDAAQSPLFLEVNPLAGLNPQDSDLVILARMAGTIIGSTETTFYVIAVYFGSVAIRRTRHAVPAGLLADVAGVQDVAVFGVPHPDFGEAVMAAITTNVGIFVLQWGGWI